ncbi:MAG: hypothetical protein KGZ83_11245 [Sulfuricella sp.]|nr:hypothetical protein [Sulfuricella sp.]
MSLSVAAKRRPADLVEIVTATSLAQGTIPAVPLLSDAFARLTACGLIVGIDGGYTLSVDAQEMLSSRRKKDDNEKMLSRIMEHLANYECKDVYPASHVGEEQLLVAVKEFRAASISPVRSLLTSKPKLKPVWIPKKDLVQGRQQLPSSRRRNKP